MESRPIDVMIMNHREVLYKGQAINLTSVNDKGEFDILSYHANFISLIRSKLVVREVGGELREFPIKRGIIRVSRNQVRVFLDVETEGEEKVPLPEIGGVGAGGTGRASRASSAGGAGVVGG